PPEARPARELEVDLGDGDRLLLHVDAPETTENRSAPSPITGPAVVMLMHGLGGCSESAYMLRISARLTALGHIVARFNHRGCGRGGAPLARQIYHAGRVHDVAQA